MKVVKIEVEGRPGHVAAIRRSDDPEAVRKMARGLQRSLDGFEGSQGDVADYFRILEPFMD